MSVLSVFNAGLQAVHPALFLPLTLQRNGPMLRIGDHKIDLRSGNIYLVSVGKAATAMAQQAELIIGDVIQKGLVVTKYQHGGDLTYCELIEAAHPVPDEQSVIAAQKVKALFEDASAQDHILFLISGGASALVTDLPEGLTLNDLQITQTILLENGADISQINTVRKQLSEIKGGQLMQRTSAKVHALILSDVIGDDLTVIASGLTVPDTTTPQQALHLFELLQINTKIPKPVIKWLQRKPFHTTTQFSHVKSKIVASNAIACNGAAQKAKALGYQTYVVTQPMVLDAEEQAKVCVTAIKKNSYHLKKPYCIIWGGETTVVVKGKGKGGRNQHMCLAAAKLLMNDKWVDENSFELLCGGTDGTDGPTDATGAMLNNAVLQQVKTQELPPELYLRNNNAYEFFNKVNALVITGPTQTNVMDLTIILVHQNKSDIS